MAGLLETIRNEARVLRSAPWSVVAIVATVGTTVWIAAGMWHDRETRFLRDQLANRGSVPQTSGVQPGAGKRLVAYGEGEVIMPFHDGDNFFNGYKLQIRNISSDGVEASLRSLLVTIDGQLVLSRENEKIGYIDPSNNANISAFRTDSEGFFPVPRDTKNIIVEYEVHYDSVPPSGLRTSYRKLSYDLRWVGAGRNAPHVEAKVIGQREG